MVAGGNDKLAAVHCKQAELTLPVRHQAHVKAQKAVKAAIPIGRERKPHTAWTNLRRCVT
jgi:hypothetical protein